MSETDEDLIDSDGVPRDLSRLRRWVDGLVPARVGRTFLGSMVAAALALGLVAGYFLGQSPNDPRAGASESSSEPAAAAEGVPGELVQTVHTDEGVLVFGLEGALLTLEDLTALGERPLPSGYSNTVVSALVGSCGAVASPQPTPSPSASVTDTGAAPSVVSFALAGASLRESISPDLDVLAASTLRGQVQLAQDCPASDGATIETDGVLGGIGDEYAAFTLHRTDPSGSVSTGFVVVFRVGFQLVEVYLAGESGGAVPDGLTRTLHIAQVAAAKMMTG